jgi:hypothetical protein
MHGKTTLVQQPVMGTTQQNGILKTSFTTIRPMHHVMRGKPLFMCAPWEATMSVPRQQCPFQWWRNHTVLSPKIQQDPFWIFSDFNQISITANTPHRLDRQVTLATLILERGIIDMHHHLIAVRIRSLVFPVTREICLGHLNQRICLLRKEGVLTRTSVNRVIVYIRHRDLQRFPDGYRVYITQSKKDSWIVEEVDGRGDEKWTRRHVIASLFNRATSAFGRSETCSQVASTFPLSYSIVALLWNAHEPSES